MYYGGLEQGWCSIMPTPVLMITFYIPTWIAMVCTSIWYIKLVSLIGQKSSFSREYKKVLIYPIIFIITWLPATIDRVYGQIMKERWVPLVVMHVIGLRLQGILFSIIFGKLLHKEYKKHWSRNRGSTMEQRLSMAYDTGEC